MPEQTTPADYPVRYDEGFPPAPFTEVAVSGGQRLRVTLTAEGSVRIQLRTERGTLRQGPQVPAEAADRIPAMVAAIRAHRAAE